MVDVYQALNSVNGKRYVGVSTRGVAHRRTSHFLSARKGSRVRFHCAIRKYGESAFQFTVLTQYATLADAHAEERRLIALLKPEYNMTAGGEGVLGLKMSPETIERIAAAHRGKPGPWLGKKRSEETKRKVGDASRGRKHPNRKRPPQSQRDKLRVLGLAKKDEWQKYARLGPASMARSVRCITDGKTYESASAAARAYAVAKSAVIELCLGKRGRKSVGGLVFGYADAAAKGSASCQSQQLAAMSPSIQTIPKLADNVIGAGRDMGCATWPGSSNTKVPD